MIRSVQASIDGGLVGRLEDGTAYFAPLGQLLWDPDEDRLKCHLCGGWFRFLGSSHLLRTHGWTLAQYREAFQLRGNVPTCSEQLSAAHRADAQRRIDADQFGARYLPSPGTRRAPMVPRWRSLAVRHPELVEQLHPERNGQIDPARIAAGSNRKLWWRCAAGHEWRATVHNRTAGWGCPHAPPPRTRGDCARSREPRLACRRSARWRSSGPSLWLSLTRRATVVLTRGDRVWVAAQAVVALPELRTRMARDGLKPRDQGHRLPALLHETPQPAARRAQSSASADRPDRALPRRASSRPVGRASPNPQRRDRPLHDRRQLPSPVVVALFRGT